MASSRAYYDENYPNYLAQNPEHKLGFYRGLVRRYVPYGASLFELGVGQGLFLGQVSRDYRCSGCDINEYGVERTRASTGLDSISVGSTERLLSGTPRDAVVAWDVLEHLPNLPLSLQHIRDALVTGGHLIAVVPVYDGPLGWLVHALDNDPTHLTKRGRRFWLSELVTAGFEVQEWGGILRKLVDSRYLHLTVPQKLLRQIGSAIYFCARRA